MLIIILLNGRKESDLKWEAINLKVTQKETKAEYFYRPKEKFIRMRQNRS